MIGSSSLLAAVLTVVSVVSLSLLSFFCLFCKRKTKVIHEENQIYDPQTFQRGGSRFAVVRSKTVTRTNQIISPTLETHAEFSPDITDDDYENIKPPAPHTGSQEHTYVDPLPNDMYANQETENTRNDDQIPGVYENFIPSLPINDDDEDYENSEYLRQHEDDEPDYVNESGDFS